ncbi:sulfatase-like hydrolase/transferase [Pelagicoccus mobilis]|uniref:Sulfatase-like hydrolase/transferase n=1 Tax=Pelagicoccus mobilis TaxID=415221 RepID=A0A934VNC8_9BACT|nr:sulfatase-like hydrolase/transferase [Pelagicoccus mobilis]MBK1876097.1 sulfatase-like hydrolase/transferase [Pelagicoccus mobilis]
MSDSVFRKLICIRNVVTIVGVALATASGVCRPNVIVIMADDLGWSDIGIQNEEATKDVLTPHIDNLFNEGLRFSNGYVASSTCGPSRASYLTGRTSSRFAMEDNNEYCVPASEVMLQEVLGSVGYTTGLMGKWHLGDRPEQQPQARGFDEFVGFLGGAQDYYKGSLIDNGEKIELEEYITDLIANEAVDFIERNHEDPFFLYVAFNAPHSPMQATQPLIERVVAHQPRFTEAYEKIKATEGENALPNYSLEPYRGKDVDVDVMRLVYSAMVAGLDDGVGKIVNAVEEAGVRENTLIVFLADNGGALALGRGRVNDFGAVNLPLRQGKGTVFDGGLRVVFGASWPGVIPQGGDYDGIVNSTDIFTTAVTLAGADLPGDRIIDGVDLMPYLTGRKDGNPHDHFFFRRFDRNSWSIRSGDFKWIRDNFSGMPPEGELYRLSDDEGELIDVSNQYPEKKKELVELYRKLTKDLPDPIAKRKE